MSPSIQKPSSGPDASMPPASPAGDQTLHIRIPVIAALAPFGGFLIYLLAEWVGSQSELSSLFTPVGLIMTFLVWITATGIALLVGPLIHWVIQRHSLPSVVILLLFCSVAAIVSWPMSQGPGQNPYLLALGIRTALTAWALYCHSPLSVWRHS